MTNSHHNPPTPGQLRLLRILADEAGSSFAYPQSFDQADEAIKELKKLKKTSRSDRRREKRQVSIDMSTRRGDSAQIRDAELSGYGSTATWSDPWADEAA